MSKSITNQRLVFKIHSSDLRVHNWDYNLSVDYAIKNGMIVSLGDSITLRMIRQINNNDITDKEITETKKQLKKYRKKKDKNKISEINNKIIQQTLERDYLLIVFDSISDWNKANSKKTKLMFNNKQYVRLIGTTGGIKNNTVVFVNKDIHKELDKKLNNGRNENIKYIPAKFESYKALACSCSTEVTQPKKILIIKDGTKIIQDNVLRLSDNLKGGFNLEKEDNYTIKKNFADGCGMISPKLAEQWAIDLGEYHYENEIKVANYIPSGFNIRNFATKGMVGTFPYVLFGQDEMNGNYMVQDCWGNYVDIREVDLILTTNMFKLWESYNSCEEFIKNCNENGFKFCVSKILPNKLEEVRNMNYQFLQSYEFSDEDIKELIKPTVDNIKSVIGVNGKNDNDYAKMLLFLKGTNISEKDFLNEELNYIKALMINKEMMKDPFIKQKIHNMIKKRIEDSKKGVIQVKGNYSIILGDLYALCESMYGLEPKGLLKANEFYSKTWLNKGVNEIIAFRAPMTIHNNIKKMKLVTNEKIEKYFKYINVCTIFNIYDTTMERLNGADFDGDAIISTNNRVLLKNYRELPTVICEQKSAKKEKITEKLLVKANKNGFGNDVGKITNRCTAMFDILAKFEKGTKEYEEMMYRITCMQGYQQEIIDSCKGIVPKTVPKEWYDYKTIKNMNEENDQDKQNKQFLMSLLANKKPYFFIYNYKHLKNDYNKFMNTYKENVIAFGKDDNYFNDLCPVSNNNSTMNRICHELEKELNGLLKPLKEEPFDTSIFITNKKLSENEKLMIDLVYEEYKHKMVSENKSNLRNRYDNLIENRQFLIKECKYRILESCNYDIEGICNYLVDILYNNPISKQFVWDICGDYIIEKLLNDNNNTINYPVLNKNGNIEWEGNNYLLIERKIDDNDRNNN